MGVGQIDGAAYTWWRAQITATLQSSQAFDALAKAMQAVSKDCPSKTRGGKNTVLSA